MILEEFKNVRGVLIDWIDKVAELYKNNVPVASGSFKNSISGEVIVNGSSYLAVLNLSEVWKYIEEGRRPGTFPPVNAIKEWITIKAITPKPFTLPNGKSRIPTTNQLSYLIGRKIKEKGIEPKPILKKTIDDLKPELFDNLSKSLTDEVIQSLMIDFKNIQ